MALLWAALPNDGVAFVADWFFQKVAFLKGLFGESWAGSYLRLRVALFPSSGNRS